MSILEEIYHNIDSNIDLHVQRLQEFLRQPSVSQTGEGIKECAELLASYFRDLGCREVSVVEPQYHSPIVYGEYDAGAEKTLIVYMMYDIQPADPIQEWSVPPFEAQLVEKPPFKKVVIARGAANTKGPLIAFINAIESIKNVANELPVNLIFVAEGEEERSSVSLPKFIRDYEEKLKKADAVYFPLSLQDETGLAIPYLGSEGILYIELETSGTHWGRGPTEFGVHGGLKRVLDSPAWRHIKMLSSLVSEDGNKILIDGWYDDIAVPTEEDAQLLEKGYRKSLPATECYDPELLKKMWKVNVFIDDLSEPKDVLSKMLFSTIFNLDGIWGGWTGPGGKTYLPYKLTSKHSIRFIPEQRLNDLLQKIRNHLDKNGYRDVQMEKIGGYTWSRGFYKSDIAEAVYDMFEEFGVDYLINPPVALGNEGLSPAWPAYLFTENPLQLPVIGAALGHGGRSHSPDEYYVIEGTVGRHGQVFGLSGVEKGVAMVLYRYAERTTTKK